MHRALVAYGVCTKGGGCAHGVGGGGRKQGIGLLGRKRGRGESTSGRHSLPKSKSLSRGSCSPISAISHIFSLVTCRSKSAATATVGAGD